VTLVELLIALIITSMLALGVASILYAASYGTSSRREVRRMVVRTEQLRARLDDAVRNARAVLASGNAYIVLWIGDTRRNNQVNLSELQLIELASGSTQLKSYETQFPGGWTEAQIEAADTAYAAGSDFAAVAQAAKQGSYFPGTTWAGGISDFSVTLDHGTPVQARMATWRLTLTNELLSESLVGTAALRSPGAPE